MESIVSIDTTVRVRYAETDAQGIVHHSSYIIWFEVGRSELFRSRGSSYRELEEQGIITVLSDLQVRYHAPARYDDLLTIRTSLQTLRSRQLSFGYQIIDQARDLLLVSGQTQHLVLDRASHKPIRLPADLLALLKGDALR